MPQLSTACVPRSAPDGHPAVHASRLRVGVVCDLLEEGWPSMDLVAQHLFGALEASPQSVDPVLLRPPMTARVTRLPLVDRWPRMRTVDRLLNRHVDYPVWLSRRADLCRIYHVVDHSYAHLVHVLPAARTVVTCHDLDAFRCLLAPDREPRSFLFRGLVRRTLDGLGQAARVLCVSHAVRADVEAAGLVPRERLRVVPNGVDPVFSPDPDEPADAAAARLLGPLRADTPEVLHVAGATPRKRLDVVLEAFAGVRREFPRARLIRAGGALGDRERQLGRALGINEALVELPFVDSRMLAAVYRRASVLLLPSDREGFGLPVIEALATGTPAVVSDIPALRETGGNAALYCAPGDAAAFDAAVSSVLAAPDPERRRRGLEHAAGFTWAAHAARVVDAYREIAGHGPA